MTTNIFEKILELKTQIITLLEVETMIAKKRIELETECEELQKKIL